MSKEYRKGDRVMTPMGPGIVNYVRMEAPTFAFPAVYSVRLDNPLPRPEIVDFHNVPYTGTIFDANVVSDLPASEVVKEIAAWLREVAGEDRGLQGIAFGIERKWGSKEPAGDITANMCPECVAELKRAGRGCATHNPM